MVELNKRSEELPFLTVTLKGGAPGVSLGIDDKFVIDMERCTGNVNCFRILTDLNGILGRYGSVPFLYRQGCV